MNSDLLKQLLKFPLPVVGGVILGAVYFSGQPAIQPATVKVLLYTVAAIVLAAAGVHIGTGPDDPAAGGKPA